MKISNKIILASVVLSAIGIITAGGLVGWQATSIAATAMEKRAFSQLIAIREIQKTQIENYFKTIEKEVITYSNDGMIINMMQQLPEPFFNYDSQSSLRDNDKIKGYYRNEFDPEYKNQKKQNSLRVFRNKGR